MIPHVIWPIALTQPDKNVMKSVSGVMIIFMSLFELELIIWNVLLVRFPVEHDIRPTNGISDNPSSRGKG